MSTAVEFHDRLAERWEAKYRKASFRAREDVLDRALAGVHLTGQRWLDAGCGTGTLSRALAAARQGDTRAAGEMGALHEKALKGELPAGR